MIILSEYGSENVHVFAEDMEISKFSNRFLLCAAAEYREKNCEHFAEREERN